jgi:probable rRNA maturation factor
LRPSGEKKKWPGERLRVQPRRGSLGRLGKPIATTPARKSTFKISLNSDTGQVPLTTRRWLVKQLKVLAALAGIDAGELRLRIVEDETMADAHLRYTNIAGTTDVLTFDLRDSLDDPIDADIMICVDEAARQAKVRGHDERMELLLYSLHGMLHLIGYDDHTKRGYAAMHKREDELLTATGLGAVFSREK